MPSTLPTALSFTDPNTTEAQFQSSLTALISYLQGLLGTSGLPVDARSALGLSGVVVNYINRGAWVTATSYAVNDLVTQSSIVYVCQTSHTAGTFATDLAAGKWTIQQGVTQSQLAAGSGSAAIGHLPSTPGAVLTTLANLAKPTDMRIFGVVSDGVTDDYTAFNKAATSGEKLIDARGLNCVLGGTINIPTGQIWMLEGTNIKITGTTLTAFSANVVNDWALLGPFTITGDGSTVGTAKGIYINDCANFYVDRPILKTIRGWGIYRTPGSSSTARGMHGTINNPRAIDCWIGYEDVDGTGAEYVTVINPHITGCSVGLITAAGNVLVHGGQIVDNVDGVHVDKNGGNNSNHGGFFGVNINHNTQFNLVTNNVLNGESFIGCHFYGLGTTGQSSIFLNMSKGILISGGVLDCQIYNYKDVNSGMNVIENMYCPGGYGVARRSGANDGHDQLIIRNCFGPGSYSMAGSGGGVDVDGININDPSVVFATMTRDPGVYQSLTSGANATLLFPSVPFKDRRLALALASGTFTVPTGQAGLYRITFDALFSGTAMTAGTSYISLRVNEVNKRLFLANMFGTTKCSITGDVTLYLAAGDFIDLYATIYGTSLTFGDSTWGSGVTFTKLA